MHGRGTKYNNIGQETEHAINYIYCEDKLVQESDEIYPDNYHKAYYDKDDRAQYFGIYPAKKET